MLAFEELGRLFTATTQQLVTFSFGSSGLLAKQVMEGAPFDVFAAANVAFVDNVVSAGACDGATKRPYARGRIVVWSRQDMAKPVAALEDLADPRFKRIAMANPEHAPYGQAAKEALEQAGIWKAVKPRLVFGENASQTLQLAATGNVEAAIVALSLVVQDKSNPWLLVPEDRHQALNQTLVACRRGSNHAGGEAFARFVGSEQGRGVMRRYGFLLPTESLP